jgi:hypothetical protein
MTIIPDHLRFLRGERPLGEVAVTACRCKTATITAA